MRELLDGPASKQRAAGDVPVETQIPEGASLEQLDVGDDGTAIVKLSPEFAGGVPAEPSERSREQQADLDARVAQVTYTLTQFEGVEGARWSSGGTVVEPQVDRRELAAPKRGPRPVVRARGPKLPGTRAIQTRLAKLSYLPKRAIDGVAGYQTDAGGDRLPVLGGPGPRRRRRPDHRRGAGDRRGGRSRGSGGPAEAARGLSRARA